MNHIQSQLLKLADTQDLGLITYYSLAKELKVDHPYKVKFALDQLIKNGYLEKVAPGSIIKPDAPRSSGVLNIPVRGQVSCGAASQVASDQVLDFLRVSPSLLQKKRLGKVFALQAVGNSMNRANIGGNTVDEGDYVLVNATEWGEAEDNDYVVSIIDEVANLKKIKVDHENRRLLLLSESTDRLDPIIIAPEDLYLYRVVGKVFNVIKKL